MALTKLAAAAAVGALSASSAFADDRITNLPGWNGTLPLYGGYITVNQTAGRALYYFLAESANSATDPLVLWLNGGPGCSSIGGGLMSELGPFYPDPNGPGLIANPYTWVQYANMIFLESPAGVGFSYSNTTSDYTVGDERSAADIYTFLQQFLVQYPQYANTPFYITGESYGGHYVTTTSAYIVKQNLAGGNPLINFQGFAVGNAWTDAGLDNTGAVEFWWGHALVSNASRTGILTTCNMSDIGPLAAHSSSIKAEDGGVLGFTPKVDASTSVSVVYSHAGYEAQTCDDWQNQANTEMGNINIYDVYVDVCADSQNNKAKSAMAALAASTRNPAKGSVAAVKASTAVRGSAAAAIVDAATAAVAPLKEGSNSAGGCAVMYNPCVDDGVATYMNRADVKAAIHARSDITWTDCSSIVNYSRFDLLTSVVPVYQYLMTANPNGRYWVYSGDVDAIVPVTGTRMWLDLLGLPITDPWRSYTVGGQVGGYTVGYQGLTFATIRNAGHMVPFTQQERAAYMFSHFLAGQAL